VYNQVNMCRRRRGAPTAGRAGGTVVTGGRDGHREDGGAASARAFAGLAADRTDLAEGDAEFLAEVIDAIERDPFVPAGCLARRLYVSQSHLAHRFRAVAGFPPGALAVAVRMQEAKRLLVETGQPVVQVALEVGYDSLGTFTSRFASLVGASPGRFRARLDEPAPDPERGILEVPDAAVTGRLTAPPGFMGLAFVGLFPSYLPAGAPTSGVVARVPGTYRLHRCQPGWYRVLVAAFGGPPRPRDLLLSHAQALGAGTLAVRVAAGGTAVCDVDLRPPAMGDPPVVVSLSMLGGIQPEPR
jgi:AraC family transcriptional regulator